MCNCKASCYTCLLGETSLIFHSIFASKFSYPCWVVFKGACISSFCSLLHIVHGFSATCPRNVESAVPTMSCFFLKYLLCSTALKLIVLPLENPFKSYLIAPKSSTLSLPVVGDIS